MLETDAYDDRKNLLYNSGKPSDLRCPELKKVFSKVRLSIWVGVYWHMGLELAQDLPERFYLNLDKTCSLCQNRCTGSPRQEIWKSQHSQDHPFPLTVVKFFSQKPECGTLKWVEFEKGVQGTNYHIKMHILKNIWRKTEMCSLGQGLSEARLRPKVREC